MGGQYLHAILRTIDQGGRVDPNGEALLGNLQRSLYIGQPDRNDQQIVATHEVEAREMLRARTALYLDTQPDTAAARPDGCVGLGDVAGV